MFLHPIVDKTRTELERVFERSERIPFGIQGAHLVRGSRAIMFPKHNPCLSGVVRRLHQVFLVKSSRRRTDVGIHGRSRSHFLFTPRRGRGRRPPVPDEGSLRVCVSRAFSEGTIEARRAKTTKWAEFTRARRRPNTYAVITPGYAAYERSAEGKSRFSCSAHCGQ